MAMSAGLPAPAPGPVIAMLKPILIGSPVCAWAIPALKASSKATARDFMTPTSWWRANSCIFSSHKRPRYFFVMAAVVDYCPRPLCQTTAGTESSSRGLITVIPSLRPTGVTPWLRCAKELPTGAAVLPTRHRRLFQRIVVEDRDGPRPAAGSGADLYREAGNQKAVG